MEMCSLWHIWILSVYLILFMFICEAFLFAMCLQQQYDFLVISAMYIVDGIIIVICVLTLLVYSLEYIHFPL
jgi:hypothetical protein